MTWQKVCEGTSQAMGKRDRTDGHDLGYFWRTSTCPVHARATVHGVALVINRLVLVRHTEAVADKGRGQHIDDASMAR